MSRIFGQIRQMGFVVRDLEAAMKYWIEVMGVGPFYVFDRIPAQNCIYRGRPFIPNVSVAFSQSGPMNIELVQQLDETPTVFQEFLARGRDGLQHLAFWPERFDEEFERYLKLGYRLAQSCEIGGPNSRTYWIERGDANEPMVELSEIGPEKREHYRKIAEEAARWDGKDPIRRVTTLKK